MSIIEAYYLLEKDEITIFDVKENKYLNSKEFFKIGKQTHHKFEEKYVIYKDLREKKSNVDVAFNSLTLPRIIAAI